MIKGTYKAELTIEFHVDERKNPVRDFAKTKEIIEGGNLTEQIRTLIEEEMGEGCVTVKLEQTEAEVWQDE